MRLYDKIQRFPVRSFLFFLVLLVPRIPARADVVFDNLTIQPSNGPTIGISIGASLITGSYGLHLTDFIFPQLNGMTNTYLPGETFSVNSRNADGTVGAGLYSLFTLTNDAASGQTTATPTLSLELAPNTGYWFVVTAAAGTSWNYTTGSTYNALYGVTQPADDVAYKTTLTGPSYFSLADGPQLFHVDGTAILVPEPSSFAWFVVAGLGIVLVLRRRRQRAHAV